MALMEQEIVEYVEVTKVTTDANTAREQEYKDLYGESAIKKQMEYLQKNWMKFILKMSPTFSALKIKSKIPA